MIWIMLVVVVSIIFAVLVLKGISKVRSKFDPVQSDGSVLDMIMDFPRISFAIIGIVVLLGIYQVKYQIGQMYNCAVRSTVQKVETQYSWYFDVCQFKNKDGAWIDFKQVRGVPEGDSE